MIFAIHGSCFIYFVTNFDDELDLLGVLDDQVLQVWLGMAITHQDLPEIFSTMCFPVVPIGSNPPMMANSMVDFFCSGTSQGTCAPLMKSTFFQIG